ncbi:hypothetical protein HAX54_021302 [Datura stramonium]|uniref:Nudix hydrolase domain-containing protein n=1 Tax=Datura stramonium TaxID=4076 RepID=A0ABS8USG7_DATST|nr:hypothetical protein [Datura stramonium]
MVDEDSHLKFFSLSLQNKDKGLLFLKGGREKDETIENAAQCETVEESGVRVQNGNMVFENKTAFGSTHISSVCNRSRFLR